MKGNYQKKKQRKKRGLQLTIEESQILFKKYFELGLDVKECDKKVREIKNHLKELTKQLRLEKKSEEEMNQIFYDEYQKLLMGAK